MEFLGYRRADGRVGVRNHLLLVSTVVCANEAVERIRRKVRSAVALVHPAGCCMLGRDLEQFKRTLAGAASSPNVGAVLAVGLGCEQIEARWLAGEAGRAGARAEALTIQECGGTRETVRRGADLARRMAEALAADARQPCTAADLLLATECGGSDYTSGLTANPAIGWAADRLIEAGGTVILSETTEIMGGEHLLAARAVSDGVARRIGAIVERVEAEAARMGVDIRGSQPTPGNIAGGLTTIEEKSLGCIYKAGKAPVQGVVEYGQRVPGKGLWIMDTPGQDVESITGMVAGGAQVVVFSTGLGTPVGCPIAPVIKLTGNPRTARAMRSHVDLSAGGVLSGRETVEKVGARLLARVLEVAGGRRTKAERLGHGEFAINRIGITI